MATAQRWMTTGEVADQLGVSPSTIRRWLKEDRLPGNKIGTRWLIQRPIAAELTAELLRAHPDTMRRWLAEGKLPGRRAGREWRIPHAKVIALVEGARPTGYIMSDN